MSIGIRSVSDIIVTSATITLNTPATGATAQVGDFLLIIHLNDFYALANMNTPSVTTGAPTINAIANANADDGATGGHQKWYWAVVNTPGAQTVTVTESAPGDEDKALIVYVLTGVDTANPIDDSNNANGAGGTSNLHVAPSVSPGSATAMMVAAANPGGGASFANYGVPGSMTLQVNHQQGGITIGSATEQLAASGATGTRTFTALFNSTRWVASSVALRADSGMSITPDSLTLPVTFGNPTLSQSFTITPSSLTLPITLGAPQVTQPSPLGPDPVEDLALALLACLQAQGARLGTDAPAEYCLRVGSEIAHDAGLNQDLCCEGLGYVSLGEIYPSSASFPEMDIIRQVQANCPVPSWAVDLQVGIIRCVPTGDADSGPSCADWNEAATLNFRDAQVLRLVSCCFKAVVPTLTFMDGMSVVTNRQLQREPLGGCTERYMSMTVQFPNIDCGC